jgi:hypothetical protein
LNLLKKKKEPALNGAGYKGGKDGLVIIENILNTVQWPVYLGSLAAYTLITFIFVRA